jgi:hypothetical protein
MARAHPEDDLQKAVAQLLDLHRWLWNHCPNGGRRFRKEAARFAGMGVKPGVPDVMIYEKWVHGDQSGFGVAIELKALTNKDGPTNFQKAWLADLKSRGWLTAVCRSLHEVEQVIAAVRGAGPPSVV